MTPERWARIEEVFGEALECPADERAAFLREACAGDEQLRQDVERLLAEERNPSFRSPAAAVAAASELPAGAMMGRYRVETRLGQGGMGVVYKAYDTQLRRPVALKILPTGRLADAESRARLMREARAASALNHPNILTVYDIGRQDGVDFIAAEYVAGKPLDALIGRKGLRLQDALRYATQIADALAAAHGAGIVHRDLKPANIMVNESGQVTVLDFGLAKWTEGAAGDESGSTRTLAPETDTGTVLGTVAYMSPEQAEAKKLDARSDMFSFGVVLYEMLTGKRAFERASTAATLAAILKEEPKAPRDLTRNLPPQLEVILMRCLRKDPARRFQGASDLKVALEELAAPEGWTVPEELAGPGHTRPKRLRALPWAAAGLALVLAAAIAGIWIGRSRTGPPDSALVPVPLTSYAGDESSPSFSPDGSQVAFTWCREWKPCQIYVKQIGVEPPSKLTDSPGDHSSPVWSPDGRTIACIRRLPSTNEAVVLIPQRGGHERVLFESEADLRPLAWTPDSKWLAYPVIETSTSGQRRWDLFLFSVETPKRRRLTTPPGERTHDFDPAFSPDGRTLVFSRGNFQNSDLHVMHLADGYTPVGKPERIASGLRAAWMPDGSEIVFCAWLNASNFSLWRGPAVGSAKPRRLAFATDRADQPAISRQGNRLAYSVLSTDDNIWRVDLGVHGRQPGTPVKLIASTKKDFFPVYSPDGAKIAYTSFASGAPEIWVCDSDGSNAAQITSLGYSQLYVSHWSPDGRSIAFTAVVGGNADIYVIGATGGAPLRLTDNPASDNWPSWSRDGKWLYFASGRTPPWGIWRMPAGGGEAVEIHRGDADHPRESPDGKWFYYSKLNPSSSSLWRLPVEGGGETKVLDTVVEWTLGREGIYFAREDKLRSNIYLWEFATGKIRTVATTHRPISLGMAVSPDERTLLYTQRDALGRDLMLVENFR